jgi:hypothetical protein
MKSLAPLLAIVLALARDGNRWQITASCPPKAGAVCDAFAIEDPDLRRRAAWQAIQEGFLSPDEETRKAIWQEITSRSSSTDLSDFLPLLDRFGPSVDPQGAPAMLDHIEITFGPRTSRIRLLGQAIRSGTVKQLHGTETPRFVAVWWAAYQGLSELRPMAEEYLASVPHSRARRRNFDPVSGLFELCEGAKNGKDCPRVAIERLRAMDPEPLRDRLASDGSFTLIPERYPVAGLAGPLIEAPLGSGGIEVRSESGERF